MADLADSGSREAGKYEMAQCDVVLLSRCGLNLPQAMVLAQAAGQFQAVVAVEKDGQTANGKSILDLLLLEAHAGTTLHIRASGPDARELVDKLSSLVKDRFGEEWPHV